MKVKNKHLIWTNRRYGINIINFGIIILTFALIIPGVSALISDQLDPNLKITIGSEVFNGIMRPTVTLENSVQKAVIRTENGGIDTGGIESTIKDWTIKSANKDIVGIMDANSFRGILSRATITVNGPNSKTVRLIFAMGSIVEYTIDANSPVIKIKYEKYDVRAVSNIVDRTNTGGEVRVYGQEGWIRTIQSSFYPCAYWESRHTNILGGCGIKYLPDPANPRSLNYKGYIIMAYGQTSSNGVGFGRIMPIYTTTTGGISVLKIFTNAGFETYQAFSGQSTRPAHYGYIYLFNQGVGNAITQGKQIVDSISSTKPSPAPPTILTPNLIKNPGFESGTISWLFHTSGTGTFMALSPGYNGTKAANLVLNSGSTNIQLYQTGVTLVPNTRYRLSFAARSSAGHDITVKLIKNISPFTNYGLVQTFDLGTNWKLFTTEFTTKGFLSIVNDGRLMFWLVPFASAGDTYYIDEVRLEKV